MRSIFGRSRVTHKVRPCAIARRQLACRHERQSALRPCRESAFQNLGGSSRFAQEGSNAVTELQALLADDDGRSTSKLGRPFARAYRRAANRAGDKARVSGKVLVRAHIEQRGTLGRANQSGELFRSDAVDGRHDASLQMSGTRYFGMSPRGEIAFPKPSIQSMRAELSRPGQNA